MTTVDEAIAQVSDVLDALKATQAAQRDSVELFAVPTVAAGELIESAWGNSVSSSIGSLESGLAANWADHGSLAAATRWGRTFGGTNGAIIGIGVDTWGNYTTLNVTLPAGPNTYDLIVTVGIQFTTTGYARLTAAVNGVAIAGAGESTSVLHSGSTQMLVHAGRTVSGPGPLTINALCLSQSGGGIGPAWATVVAVPSG